MVATISLVSCSSDDKAPAPEGNASLVLKFDNVYADANLILGGQPYVTSEGETITVDQLKYIVSNIKLTKADGTVFTYPKAESYFIVDETEGDINYITLTDVPAGDYVSASFGIGVDEQQWDLGADGQGDFLAWADAEGMMWSWSAGYKFLMVEGTFTSATVADPAVYMVHTGKTGTDYNYTTVSVDFPATALVRTNITPEVHIFADASKIIDGGNKISLSANNMGGMGAMIMGGANLPLITANLSEMFSVDHVHND